MICKRWYHPNLTGANAVSLLKSKGYDGSFVIRPSWNFPGDYTLNVRYHDDVVNLKIQNTGDCYLIFEDDSFSTLAELVQHYTELKQPLHTLNGQHLQLLHPLYDVDPTSERWYHGNIAKADADALLMEQAISTFLVRASIRQPGCFALTVKTSDTSVTHFLIDTDKDGQYRLSPSGKHIDIAPKFDSLSDLVDHYRASRVLKLADSDLSIQLGQPVNSSRINASGIADRVIVMDKEKQQGIGKGGFSEEFQYLQQEEEKLLFDRNNGKNPENRVKNRYKNVLPFDHSRVLLRDGDPDIAQSDYINANYISIDDDGCRRTAYIATQGCMPVTIVDFWRMIWQENSCIIVNLTKEIEKGKNKCACYWTRENEEPRVFTIFGGQLRLTCKKNVNMDGYVVREFELKRLQEEDGELVLVGTKTVFQFHYIAWPDKSVPENPGSLLTFHREVGDLLESLPGCGPIVVHCSAGIGRTGAWLVIDIIVNNIRRNGLECEIDVMKTVQRVRGQRSGMVQTDAQYRFIYLSIKHYIETARIRQAVPHVSSAVTESEYGNLYGSALQPNKPKSAANTPYENVTPKKPTPSVRKSKTKV